MESNKEQIIKAIESSKNAFKKSKVYQKQLQEKKHKTGYLKNPVKLHEFSDWENDF